MRADASLVLGGLQVSDNCARLAALEQQLRVADALARGAVLFVLSSVVVRALPRPSRRRERLVLKELHRDRARQ
ncbi:hypothetical protein GCM10020369_30190 [Cryptosporangium minutisporangium]|uniref:Uncharacterized protein n=1 Tax=Cryptosporangium minutisporangium TaxID=113569 RepID=A0ABP6SWX1_9ACTN